MMPINHAEDVFWCAPLSMEMSELRDRAARVFVSAALAERELHRQFENGEVISVDAAEKQAARRIRDLENALQPKPGLPPAGLDAGFILQSLAQDPRGINEVFPELPENEIIEAA
jgi:hypothetical protein